MLTQQEKDYMRYWEAHREKEADWRHQLMAGLPLGICFGLPILLSFIFRNWYKWLPFMTGSTILFIMIAVMGIVLFFSIFRQKFLWEKKEQQYLEFKAKSNKEGDVPSAT